MKLNNFPKKLLCWGGSDQAIVLKPIIENLGSKYDIIIDDTPNLRSPFPNIEILQGKSEFEPWLKGRNASEIGFIIAIGNPYGCVRCHLHDYLVGMGLKAVSICDTSALVDKDVSIGEGAQIMKGAVVNSKAVIGRQCIINTRSIIEHHDMLEEGVEVGPGAILCGRVKVQKYSWIGAGATVLPRLTIESNTIIGGGALVNTNVQSDAIFVGVPARFLKDNPYKVS
jgi:sugar O-acyltransferase (sialic acid O-acetyltransferase NeuD family)